MSHAKSMETVSRRLFLAGSIASIALTADVAYTAEIRKQRNNVDLQTVDNPETKEKFPSTAWFVLPGLKTSWEETDWIAQSLEPVMRERGQVKRLGYSNDGLNVREIYHAMRRHIADENLKTIHLYGHSFGGMLAVEMAATLERDPDVDVAVDLIVLDSSPNSQFDVIDQTSFNGLTQIHAQTKITPTAGVRLAYEFSERVVNKNERSWQQVIDQTLEQLSPLAPSTELIQSELWYIQQYDASRFRDSIQPDTKIVFMGNPNDATVNFTRTREQWRHDFPSNFLPVSYITHGALPAHASPQWNADIYQLQLSEIQRFMLPIPDELTTQQQSSSRAW